MSRLLMISDRFLPWLWVGCAFVGVFVMSIAFIVPWFDEWIRISADVSIMLSAMALIGVLVLWRGLAPMAWVVGSKLMPFLVAYFFVMLASAWINRSAGALQVLTVEAAYGALLLGAAVLWQSPNRRQVLATWCGGSLLLVSIFNLYDALSWYGENQALYGLDRLSALPWHEAFFSLTRIFWNGSFDYPFYNSNYTAAFQLPLALAVLAALKSGLYGRHDSWRLAWWSVLLMLPILITTSKSAVLVYMSCLPLIDKKAFYLCLSISLIIVAQLTGSSSLGVLLLGAAFICVIGTKLKLRGQRILMMAGVTFTLLSVVTLLIVTPHEGLKKGWEQFRFDTSMGMRTWMWEGVWRAVTEGHPGPEIPAVQRDPSFAVANKWVRRVVGYGPGEYAMRSAAWRHPEYYATNYASDYTVHPHNSLASMLSDGGFAGLAVGLLLFGQIFNMLRRLKRAAGETGQWAGILFPVAVGLALHSMLTVAAGFSVQRLHWMLVLGGIVALELGHRQRKPEGARWPADFKGPVLALGVGLIFVFCCRGSVVLVERWQAFGEYEKIRGEFFQRRQWERDQEDSKLVDPNEMPPKVVPLGRLEASMNRSETSAMVGEGRRWVSFHVIKHLKKIAVDREQLGVLASQQSNDPVTRGRWKIQALSNLKHALDKAPDFVDLSRLYGEILFALTLNARRSDVSEMNINGRRASVAEFENLAVAWYGHSLRKGTLDYYSFRTLLDEPAMHGLDRRLKGAVAQSPIFNPVFERRLLAGKKIKIPLQRSWYRWKLLRGSETEADEAAVGAARWVESVPKKNRAGLARSLALDLLTRAGNGSISPRIFDLLRAGGKVGSHSQDPRDYKLGLLRATIWGHGREALGNIEQMNVDMAQKKQLKRLIVYFLEKQ